MKAIRNKTVVVLLAFVLCLNARSSTGTGALNQAAVQKEIRAHLNIPVEKNEKVEVVFTTDKTGQVNLAIARTGNRELQKMVEFEFSRLRLRGLRPGDCYSVTLSLKLL